MVLGALALVGAVVVAASRSRRAVVATALVGILLGGAAAVLHVDRSTGDPIATWAHRHAQVDLTVLVQSDPQRRDPKPGSWAPPRLEVRARTIRIDRAGESVVVALPVVLRARVGTVMPAAGSVATVSGRLSGSARWDLAAAVTVVEDPRVVAAPSPVDRAANAMRDGLRRALEHTSLSGAPLVAGLAVGDESLADRDLTAAMRATGLAHLTAVSGGNVAILLGIVLMVAGVVRLRIGARVVAGLAALAFFVVLVRPEPSVVRAAVMGSVSIVSILTGGRRLGPTVLATAVLVVSVVAPALAVTWGFALSVFATAGIILIAPRLIRRLETGRRTARWPRALTEAVALTAAAQLATLPVLVGMGGAVGWIGIPANLLAMPVVPAVTVLGLAAAVLAPLAPVPAMWVAHLAAVPATWIAFVAERGASLPLPGLPVPTGWAGEAVLAVAAVILVAAVRLRRRIAVPPTVRWLAWTGAVTIAVLLVVAPFSRRGWPPPGWVMTMCDVGQGEAVVLRSGVASAIVVDVGPVPDLVDRCLRDLGIERIDAVLLTHFHADHAMGLTGVARGRPIGRALVTTLDDPPDQAADALRWFASHGIPVARLHVGDEVTVGEVRGRVLWPGQTVAGGSAPNNASVVLLADVAGTRVLLTGDIEAEAQAAVMRTGPVAADVATVPHHGSPNQDPGFASWVHASVGLISVGRDNDYGHPAGETVAAWRAIGLVGRTDELGDLAVVRTADGNLGVVSHRG